MGVHLDEARAAIIRLTVFPRDILGSAHSL